MNEDDKKIFIFNPESFQLMFGEEDSQFFQSISHEIQQKKSDEFFIDLKRKFFISNDGVKFLITLIDNVRELGIVPYIIASSHLSEILQKTLLGKIVKIVNNYNFERENTSQVEDLEKNMLWGI